MKTIDITNQLQDESVKIKIAEGKEYEVNDSYKVLLEAMDLFDDEAELTGKESLERMLICIEKIIGKEARKYCESMKIKQIQTIFSACISAVQGDEVSEGENFQ